MIYDIIFLLIVLLIFGGILVDFFVTLFPMWRKWGRNA